MESSVLFCYFFYSPRVIVVEEIFLYGRQETVVWLVTAVVWMVTWTVFTQGQSMPSFTSAPDLMDYKNKSKSMPPGNIHWGRIVESSTLKQPFNLKQGESEIGK